MNVGARGLRLELQPSIGQMVDKQGASPYFNAEFADFPLDGPICCMPESLPAVIVVVIIVNVCGYKLLTH